MRTRPFLAVIALTVLTACAGGPQPATVGIMDFAFEPEQVEVQPGTTVVWEYSEEGGSRHTVSFSDGTMSPDLSPGQRYERTFTEPGSYAYACFFHPSMTGSVTVAG